MSTAEPDPDLFGSPTSEMPEIVWWQGWTACTICGYGTPGHAVPHVQSVVPIPEGQDMPVVPLECPGCGNRTLNPIDDDEDEDDG